MSTTKNDKNQSYNEHYDNNLKHDCQVINHMNDSSMKNITKKNDKRIYGDLENCSKQHVSDVSSKSLKSMIHMILVVIASSTINGVVFGVVNNFGVFYVSLIELFKSDSSLLSLSAEKVILGDNQTHSPPPPDDTFLQPLIAGVGSLNIGLIFFCSIFASVLSDRYGIRRVCIVGGILSTIGMYASSVSVNLIYLYITYGLVLGIGASLVYAPSLAILGHYFDRRLGLVNGLVTAGSSFFSIVMPILLRMLINQVGIQTTFKYLTIPMVALIFAASTFKERIPKTRDEKSINNQRSESKQSLSAMFFYEELWHNRLYLCWVISIPAGLFGYFVPFCHLVKHAQDIKSPYPGEVLVMSIGIFSLLGRLISGPIADRKWINRIVLQLVAFASIGILTIALIMVRDEALLAVCCGLGLFDGFFISLIGPIAFDLVGPSNANQAIGLLLCFCSLPLTCGPPIAAYVYGLYGNYKLAFFLAGLPPIIAAAMMLITMRSQNNSNEKSLHSQRQRAHSFVDGNGKFTSLDELKISNGSHTSNDNGEKLCLLDKTNNEKSDTQTSVIA